jgi:hypothetical protein
MMMMMRAEQRSIKLQTSERVREKQKQVGTKSKVKTHKKTVERERVRERENKVVTKNSEKCKEMCVERQFPQ